MNYAYKASGALESIGTSMIGGDALNKTNVIDSLSYRSFGSASQVVYGNDRKLDLTYTAGLNRLTNMTATRWDGSEKMIDHNYTYADNGLISRTDDAMDTVYSKAYAYNYRNQLTTVYGANYSQTGYSFDNFGNMTNGMTFPMIGTSSAPVNNRPSSFNNGSATINFSYDNSGNMTAAGARTYQWDGANRLKSVNGGTSGSYGFDGNGKRVKKTEGGASTYYVYSSVIGDAVMEVNSSGVQRAYVSGGRGKLIAQRNPDGQFYWSHHDHLGSGRKMTNTSGNLTYRAEFDPYGKLLYEWSATPNQNTKKFTGYERDAGSGLDYAQARMYGSEWGRFLSPDPAGFKSSRLTSPLSFNLYAYVEGNPVNFIDPTGLSLWSWLGEHVFEPLGDFFGSIGNWIGSHIGGGGGYGGGGIGGGGGGNGGGGLGGDGGYGFPLIIIAPPSSNAVDPRITFTRVRSDFREKQFLASFPAKGVGQAQLELPKELCKAKTEFTLTIHFQYEGLKRLLLPGQEISLYRSRTWLDDDTALDLIDWDIKDGDVDPDANPVGGNVRSASLILKLKAKNDLTSEKVHFQVAGELSGSFYGSQGVKESVYQRSSTAYLVCSE